MDNKILWFITYTIQSILYRKVSLCYIKTKSNYISFESHTEQLENACKCVEFIIETYHKEGINQSACKLLI